MNSIDNLRNYVLTASRICSTTRAILVGYIDEIEREVEELRDRDYRNGREDAKGAVEFADRLKAAVDKREDVTLFGVDYTPLELVKEHLANRCMTLPLDADGVPIHVGDVMEVISSKQHEKACYMQMGPSGTWAVGLTQDCHWYDTESLLHHATTVEDVLREFAGAWVEWKDGAAMMNPVETFAARLRLAGDE